MWVNRANPPKPDADADAGAGVAKLNADCGCFVMRVRNPLKEGTLSPAAAIDDAAGVRAGKDTAVVLDG